MKRTNCLSKIGAAVTGLFSLLLCGCSTTQVFGKFQGLQSIQRDAKHLHIVMVHGISRHSPGWSKDFHNKLAASLNLRLEKDEAWGKCIAIDGKGEFAEMAGCDESKIPETADGVIRSVVLRPADGNKETSAVTITEVTWSPITSALKKTLLDYDKESGLSNKRALINKKLREGLIDDGFSDALAYSGEAGERIRQVVWHAICHSLAGNPQNGGKCDMQGSGQRFAFITHSLGSRVVFDLLHVDAREEEDAARRNEISLMQQHALKQKISGNTVAVYMLANQLPLLEMAGAPRAGVGEQAGNADGLKLFRADKAPSPISGTNAIARFLQDRRGAIKKQESLEFMAQKVPQPPLSIAAFSDPNDLLSYSLCHSGMRRLEDVELSDIWVSNAPNLYLFADPAAAHQGYWTNKDVIKLLIGGKEEGRQTCGNGAGNDGR